MADETRRDFLLRTTAASLSCIGANALGQQPQEPRPAPVTTTDTLDEALHRLANTGPDYGPGFANHGPMAVEALLAMERPAAVAKFLDRYLPSLQPAPALGKPFTESSDFTAALGDTAAYPRFEATFAREIAEQPWRSVIARHATALLPGLMGALAHGVIRTAHAARAMASHDTPERRGELARALAYWASHHQALLGEPGGGTTAPLAALPRVPLLPDAQKKQSSGSSAQRLAEVTALEPWRDAAGAAGPAAATPAAAASFAHELLGAAARVFVQNGRAAPIFFVHAVTAVAAVEVLLPLLAADAQSLACRHAWRLVAAIQARLGPAPFRDEEPVAAGVPDELADRAVANGDEHVIKLTSACLVAHRTGPQPAFLAAAAQVSDLL